MKRISDGLSAKIANMGFMCACLVVFIHVVYSPVRGSFGWWIAELTHHGVCFVAVPFFFIFSGFFLGLHVDGSGWYKREVLKRVKSLLIPFLVFATLFFILQTSFSLGVNLCHGKGLTLSFGLEELQYVYGLNWFKLVRYNLLWYLRALFVLVLISPLLAKVVRTGTCGLLVLFLPYGLTPFLNPGSSLETFFEFGFSLKGLFYFSVGLYLALHRQEFRISRILVIGSLALSLVLLVARSLLYDCPILSRYCFLFFIPTFMLPLWALFPVEQKAWRVSCYSLPLYLLHGIPIFLIEGLVNNVPSARALLRENLPMFFVTWCAVICCTLLAARIWRVKLPKSYGLAMGGRA